MAPGSWARATSSNGHFVTGRSVEHGGRGDPSPVTAESVFQALLRGLHAATGSAEVDGRRIGVVGLGKVGYVLAARLAQAGGRIVACDLDAARCERFTSEYGGEIAPSAEAIMSTGPGYASFRWAGLIGHAGVVNGRQSEKLRQGHVQEGSAQTVLDQRAPTSQVLYSVEIPCRMQVGADPDRFDRGQRPGAVARAFPGDPLSVVTEDRRLVPIALV